MGHRSSHRLFGLRHSVFTLFLIGFCFYGVSGGRLAAQTAVQTTLDSIIAPQQAEVVEAQVIKTAKEFFENLEAQKGPFGFAIPGHRAVYEMPEGEVLKIIAALRKQYPMESLKERLGQINHPDRIARLQAIDRGIPDPPAGEESLAPDVFFQWQPYRVQALARLHSEKANEFVMTQGFGYERMPRITPNMLRYPQVGPVALHTEYDASFRFSAEPLVELNDAGATGSADGEANYSMPALQTVVDLSRQGRHLFLDGGRIGLVRDDGHVAGFMGHGISELDYPPLGIALTVSEDRGETESLPASSDDHDAAADARGVTPEGEHWKLNRLELVSLLMHDEARVYVSEQLPEMTAAQKNAETRKLDAFELSSLKMLFGGEEVATEATPNRIRMLGALRASENCLECHSVKAGSLLGALSYELLRKPEVDCR
jgi:hypothetical protein